MIKPGFKFRSVDYRGYAINLYAVLDMCYRRTIMRCSKELEISPFSGYWSVEEVKSKLALAGGGEY